MATVQTNDAMLAVLNTKYGTTTLADGIAAFNRSRGLEVSNGVAYVYSSDPGAVHPAGDLDIRIRMTVPDWTPTVGIAAAALDNNGGAGHLSAFLRYTVAGGLQADVSLDGTTVWNAVSSQLHGFVDGSTHWLRYVIIPNNGSGSKEVRFYTSNDNTNDAGIVNWTPLGVPQTQAGTGTGVFHFAGDVPILGWSSGEPVGLRYHSYEARSGINGTPWVTFRIAEGRNENQAVGIPDAQGHLWVNHANMRRRNPLNDQSLWDFYTAELAYIGQTSDGATVADKANKFWSTVTAAQL